MTVHESIGLYMGAIALALLIGYIAARIKINRMQAAGKGNLAKQAKGASKTQKTREKPRENR
ncbi:hypothetical protein HM1_2588 [Heliomicrobium modesticaldum Ice1]|uniref:Uncharacterized protein n=1 Tax=Heliobacterium modesticaldum (strain ATCC 51547 / Ice1) TaxID=498761 RepID=B0TB13_HELMI|nr:hypothetical protein [Heliomicrobium modesticaldum]ABZ85124.1 hypothetical protein HM1_2588 [Heliomicrobium modesticaldum Ice1]